MKVLTPIQGQHIRQRIRGMADADFKAIQDFLTAQFVDVAGNVANARPGVTGSAEDIWKRAGALAQIEAIAEELHRIRTTPLEAAPKEPNT